MDGRTINHIVSIDHGSYPPWFLGVSVCCIRGGRQRADKVPEVVVNFGAIEDYFERARLACGSEANAYHAGMDSHFIHVTDENRCLLI